MAKRRIHTSAMWENPKFAKLTIRQRLLFCGLIDCVDDQGRMIANPLFVRAKVFPFDDLKPEDIEEDLNALSQNGSIMIYTSPGKEERILQIVNWWIYQNPQWAAPSALPPPDGWKDRIRHKLRPNLIITYNWTTPSGKRMPDTCTPDGKPIGIGDDLGMDEGSEPGDDLGIDEGDMHDEVLGSVPGSLPRSNSGSAQGSGHASRFTLHASRIGGGGDARAQNLARFLAGLGYSTENAAVLGGIAAQNGWEERDIEAWWRHIHEHNSRYKRRGRIENPLGYLRAKIEADDRVSERRMAELFGFADAARETEQRLVLAQEMPALSEVEQIWQRVLESLRMQLTNSAWNAVHSTWAEQMGDKWVVHCPTPLVLDWVKNRGANLIRRALEDEVGYSVAVEFV